MVKLFLETALGYVPGNTLMMYLRDYVHDRQNCHHNLLRQYAQRNFGS